MVPDIPHQHITTSPYHHDYDHDHDVATATSILPAGTVMKDLSILKDKPDPLALPDNDYPDWLWTLTDEALADSQSGKKAAELDAEGQMGDARGIGQVGKGFDRQAERRKLRARWVLVLALSFIQYRSRSRHPYPCFYPHGCSYSGRSITWDGMGIVSDPNVIVASTVVYHIDVF
jgi:hypothetical protein